ncbi:MAG: hypothetical protein ACF8QF_14735 [Phycisphaerales bacterium]
MPKPINTPAHAARRVALAIACAAALALLTACSRGEARSAQDIRETYARQLVEGAASGFTVIKADRYDAATGMLHDIRIEDGERIIHAERAEILVSTEMQTVSLRLYEVVGADETTGAFIDLEGLTTDPAPIRVGRGGE